MVETFPSRYRSEVRGESIEIYPREISIKYRDEAGRSRWEGSRRDEAA